MHIRFIRIIAHQEIRSVFRSRMPLVLYTLLFAMLLLAWWLGFSYVEKFNAQQARFSQDVEEHWMNQPDRHPHRVAHYGYLVFREKSPLSFFDFGLDSYVGNSVFLEAHRQNTVNMSEVGFSNGMLRFGELSMAMMLQLLVPLFIIFLGFATVSGLKQHGVLKILLSQRASFFDVLTGKAAGLTAVTWMLFLPPTIAGLLAGNVLLQQELSMDTLIRIGMIVVAYALYFMVMATLVTAISAVSKTPAAALVSLILLWMVCFIILPKSAQTLGAHLFAAPDKIAFEQAIQDEVRREGDSHNPDDSHFAQLRISTLKKYGVDSIQQLPVNYGALVMQEGERISAGIFNRHFEKLMHIYQLQNSVATWLGFIDPYLSIRHVSMNLSGVDFDTFSEFQRQTEQYRFDKTTRLNNIHLTQIQYQNDRGQKVARSNWQEQPPFKFGPVTLADAAAHSGLAFLSLACWVAAALLLLRLIASVRQFQL